MGRSGMAFSEFTDIARIEVLQGPQGTLFGKNASAGVVNMITQSPTADAQHRLSASWYQGGEWRADYNATGPLSATAGYAISAIYADFPGNVYNAYNGQQVNGFHRDGLRGKLAFDLDDSVKLTLAADYVHADDNCCADVLGTYLPSAQATAIFFPSLLPVVPGPQNKAVNNDLTPETVDDNEGVSAQFDWSVGAGTLTSITAYRRWSNYQQRDGDFHSSYANYVASLATGF